MGKKTKVGKSRRDKYYQLAKDTGYRSRASFKLLQLNRKHEFLQKSSICIDLCAAPGGWLQVAQQFMPISSLIIGVDLVTIKPIPGVITFQADITTDKCRQQLKKLLPDHKADLVLNDGAPNVGKNWVHDAYQQSMLTLEALKLACKFLSKGGSFVTKIFRSTDYFSLIWVFNQLFKKVHATKPLASRNESAEIFVVCLGFLAPDVLDPKFFDPKHVFKQVEKETSTPTINIIHPSKVNKRKDGYEEGDFTHQKPLNASTFVASDDYLELFKHCTQIILDDDEIKQHEATTTEVKECCKDIRVLGKKDIKGLLTWRKLIHQHLQAIKKQENGQIKENEEKEHESDMDSVEEELRKNDEDVMEKRVELLKDKKRKRKKVMKEKRKLRDKMALDMIHPGDSLGVTDDPDLFNLSKLRKDTGSEFRHDDADMDEEDDGGGGKEVEVEKTSNKITFDRDDTALYDDEGEAWNKLKRKYKEEVSDSEDDEEEEKEEPKEKKKKVVKLTPMELALGEEIASSKKRKREILEMSYNRFTYGTDSAPDWFVQDEMKHTRKQLPVTKEQVEYYRSQQKAINANPIKKVAEAQSRKKKRMARKLEKVRKKVEAMGEDIPEDEKLKQTKDLYKKAGLLKSKKKEEITYVVGKKGVGKRVRRPKGVKGRFKVVDPRMKKDLKADNKKRDREKKSGKSGKKGKNSGYQGTRRKANGKKR